MNNHHKPRPFVCNGNPYNCEVFIVGSNAVTEMEAEFWDFWDNCDGFDKERWFKSYIDERKNNPLKSGKTRRDKVSPTRRNIGLIVNSISPISCLETNIYLKATPTKRGLSYDEKDTSVFEFLLEEIKPKVIFSYSIRAREHLESLSKTTIRKDETTEVSIFKTKTKILSMSHLPIGWSKNRALKTGQCLNTLYYNYKLKHKNFMLK